MDRDASTLERRNTPAYISDEQELGGDARRIAHNEADVAIVNVVCSQLGYELRECAGAFIDEADSWRTRLGLRLCVAKQCPSMQVLAGNGNRGKYHRVSLPRSATAAMAF